jgi:hypothetical protein
MPLARGSLLRHPSLYLALALTLLPAGAGAASADVPGRAALPDVVRLNEIRIDEPGPDRHEFFELSGTPGESLDGISYLVLGDDPRGGLGSGVVETCISLDGRHLDQNGLLVVGDLVRRFENTDNVTHMLVRGFVGTLGEDLDHDDDGVLDSMPFAEIVYRLALISTDPDLAGDRIYSQLRVGPDHGFVPAHVFRDGDRWVIGSYEIGDDDTPGRDNLDSVAARQKAARIAR